MSRVDFIHPTPPALEVVREIVDERAATRNYHHRLMDYNNDAKTHLDDVQSLFKEALDRIEKMESHLRLHQRLIDKGAAKLLHIGPPGAIIRWVMPTNIRSFVGSTQNQVSAAPSQKKVPLPTTSSA